MTAQPTITLSHRFIAALDGQRDRLFALAQAASAEAAATGGTVSGRSEILLQSAIREVFLAFEKDPLVDPPAAVEKAILARVPGGTATATPAEAAMPADIWARLVATVQVEAARSLHTRAINPDSVLLSPDPLLAPKKAGGSDNGDRFDLSPSSRFLLAAGIAVVIGVGLTVYLLTRPPSPPGGMTRPGSATAGAGSATGASTTMPVRAP